MAVEPSESTQATTTAPTGFPLEAPPDFALSEGGGAPTKLWKAFVRLLREQVGGTKRPAD